MASKDKPDPAGKSRSIKEAIFALTAQVKTMVEESGDLGGFDAEQWVAEWVILPLPALGGKTPASYLITAEGQKLVSNLLAMTQSGAYA